MKTVQIGGESYVSINQASEILGYSRDYVGQLCRSSTFSCKRTSGQWFVLEEELQKRTQKADKEKEETFEDAEKVTDQKKSTVVGADEVNDKTPLHKVKVGNVRDDSLVFDGEEYVTTARGAALTGYAQDYVGELAREKEVPARKNGRQWFVHKKDLLEHKEQKDALLAKVQAEASGVESVKGEIPIKSRLNFSATYVAETPEPMPLRKGTHEDSLLPNSATAQLGAVSVHEEISNAAVSAKEGGQLSAASKDAAPGVGSPVGAEVYFPQVSSRQASLRDTKKQHKISSEMHKNKAEKLKVLSGGYTQDRNAVSTVAPDAMYAPRSRASFLGWVFFVVAIASFCCVGYGLFLLHQQGYFSDLSSLYPLHLPAIDLGSDVYHFVPGNKVEYSSQ